MELNLIDYLNDALYTFIPIVGIGLIYFINKITNDFIMNLVKQSLKKIVDFATGEKIGLNSQEIINSINSDLSELRIYTKSDRAYVLEFHNGSEYLSKFPQWKLSQSYEKNGAGISYEGYEFQGIPATLIWDDYLKIFFDNDIELPKGIEKYKSTDCNNICGIRNIYIITVDLLDYDAGPLRNILEKRGVKKVVQTSIVSKTNKSIIGIAGIDYMDEDNFNFDNICSICKFSSQLSFTWSNIVEKQKILSHNIKILKNN